MIDRSLTPIIADPGQRRLLTLDGGGIYGYFTALMLKKLCKKNENFLTGNDISLFAGTSIGAVIALSLAKEDSPRDYVLSGQLEKDVSAGLLYNNALSPIQAVTSYSLIPAWTGSRSSEVYFKRMFGDMTLGDLKQRVLIATFNMYDDFSPENQPQSAWKPKIFYNFPDHEEDRDRLVRDVAYGAISLLAWRPVKKGISDGGIFDDNPAVLALAKVLAEIRIANETRQPHEPHRHIDDVMNDIHLLSLGVGTDMPSYFTPNFNLGLLSFNIIPTNIWTQNYFPPISRLMLEPSTESATYEAKQLLGNQFFRLSPQAVRFPVPPVLYAVYWSRYTFWRSFYCRQIRKMAKEPHVKEAVQITLDWMANNSWA